MKQIPLSRGQFAIVDDEDYDHLVARGKWHCTRSGYAVRTEKQLGRKVYIFMHRLIVNAPKNKVADHIDRNSLNNQRSNLRICTQAENSRNATLSKNNTSGFNGVTWCKSGKKWRVLIEVDRIKKNIGLFSCKVEAAKAYNEAAIKYHGEFAKINDIPKEYAIFEPNPSNGSFGWIVWIPNKIRMCEVIIDIDGFYKLDTSSFGGGLMESYHLRVIADKIKELNRPYEDKLAAYFDSLPREIDRAVQDDGLPF